MSPSMKRNRAWRLAAAIAAGNEILAAKGADELEIHAAQMRARRIIHGKNLPRFLREKIDRHLDGRR